MDNLNTLDNMSQNAHTKLFKSRKSGASGNNPTPLKTPDFKGFYSSYFAIDSKMTAKNIEDALLFTAEHLFCGTLYVELLCNFAKYGFIDFNR